MSLLNRRLSTPLTYSAISRLFSTTRATSQLIPRATSQSSLTTPTPMLIPLLTRNFSVDMCSKLGSLTASSSVIPPSGTPTPILIPLLTRNFSVDICSKLGSLTASSSFIPPSGFNRDDITPHLARTYYEELPFRGEGKVEKPPIEELIQKEDFRCYVEQRQISDKSPEDPVIELCFLQAPALDDSLVPRFRVHCLIAASVEEGQLIHHVDNDIRQTPQWSRIRDQTKKDIAAEVEAMGIKVDEFKKFWFDDGKSAEMFWSLRFLKHHRFSNSVCISNYVALIWKFADEYLIEKEGRDSLGQHLAKKKFVSGKYHKSEEYLNALDDYFKVKAYASFKNHGTHPSSKEINVLLSKDGTKLRDHPNHDKVAKGKFLMRNI